MAIELKMPALSPTMEEGTLARWLVKVGDEITSGDIMAEIETDKATMEFEAVDEGTLAAILVEEGTENVSVGTVIAMLAEDGEDVGDVSAPAASSAPAPVAKEQSEPAAKAAPVSPDSPKASPLARRIAANEGVDLAGVEGSGPKGRIVKADVEAAAGGAPKAAPARSSDRVIASPLAKKLAGEKGIDLSAVSGTGPGGRVIKTDIEGFRKGVESLEAKLNDKGIPYTPARENFREE